VRDSVKAALTGAEYPLFFAPEVVHLQAKYEITLEVSSQAEVGIGVNAGYE
jgi:hypothetical protein